MIASHEFVGALADQGVRLVTGVPDSTLKTLLPAFDAHPEVHHVLTTTEGEAISMAFGHRIATGGQTLTYLQNSGLGDLVDVLTSIAAPEVYAVPLLLLIGWRGRPGVHDEPQHRRMGKLTEPLLGLLGVRCEIIKEDAWLESVEHTCETVCRGISCAMLVEKGTFSGSIPEPPGSDRPLSREEALARVIDATPSDAVFVSTVGGISRELYELRGRAIPPQPLTQDLYTVGAMGSALAVGYGVALGHPARKVIVLDGDGAALMGLGTLATVGRQAPPNLVHVVLDNGVHDSTGAQPTASSTTDLAAVARACGYTSARNARDERDLAAALGRALTTTGTSLVVVKIRPGARADLGRPALDFAKHGKEFINGLRS